MNAAQKPASIGRRAQTARRVLDAARSLFEQQGYEAVTVRMIADAAGVAVGSVFTGHEGKAALMAEIIHEDLNRFIEEGARAAEAAADQPLLERLRCVFRPALEFDVGHPARLADAQALSWRRGEDNMMCANGASARLLRFLREQLAQAVTRKELAATADIAVLAEALMHLYWGNLRRVTLAQFDLDDIEARFIGQVELLLAGAAPGR